MMEVLVVFGVRGLLLLVDETRTDEEIVGLEVGILLPEMIDVVVKI